MDFAWPQMFTFGWFVAWIIIILFLSIPAMILVRLWNSTALPEAPPFVCNSEEEALELVDLLISDEFKIQDVFNNFNDHKHRITNLGSSVEVSKLNDAEIIIVFFPVGHPKEDKIKNFRIGENVIFVKLSEPIEGLDLKNASTYLEMKLA